MALAYQRPYAFCYLTEWRRSSYGAEHECPRAGEHTHLMCDSGCSERIVPGGIVSDAPEFGMTAARCACGAPMRVISRLVVTG